MSQLSNSKKVFKEFFRINGPRNWMEYILFRKHFENKGWDVAEYDSTDSEEEWQEIEDDPNSIRIPVFTPYGKIIPGCAIYFTPPEEIEEPSDTLPGGFRVGTEWNEYTDEDLYDGYDVCDLASTYTNLAQLVKNN